MENYEEGYQGVDAKMHKQKTEEGTDVLARFSPKSDDLGIPEGTEK